MEMVCIYAFRTERCSSCQRQDSAASVWPLERARRAKLEAPLLRSRHPRLVTSTQNNSPTLLLRAWLMAT